jgi:hypothetical protein
MDDSFECPRCGVMAFPDELTCPACKGRLRYKTFKEAFCAQTGLGAFDLIPGIRDLPNAVRISLMFAAYAEFGTLISLLLGFPLGFALLVGASGLTLLPACYLLSQ